MNEPFLRRAPLLRGLTPEQLWAVADVAWEEKFNYNDKICTQGESGDLFYFVKTGTAICTRYDPVTDDEKVVATLAPGDYFGEIALLTHRCRQATVISQENLSVLVMDAVNFWRVLSSVHDSLVESSAYMNGNRIFAST